MHAVTFNTPLVALRPKNILLAEGRLRGLHTVCKFWGYFGNCEAWGHLYKGLPTRFGQLIREESLHG